ncbi:MAG: hypothetical protein JKY83_00470 [Rhizobiaceae bacterium]|nr:hypothetical protein [Rhizobiaceae bacterium]
MDVAEKLTPLELMSIRAPLVELAMRVMPATPAVGETKVSPLFEDWKKLLTTPEGGVVVENPDRTGPRGPVVFTVALVAAVRSRTIEDVPVTEKSPAALALAVASISAPWTTLEENVPELDPAKVCAVGEMIFAPIPTPKPFAREIPASPPLIAAENADVAA